MSTKSKEVIGYDIWSDGEVWLRVTTPESAEMYREALTNNEHKDVHVVTVYKENKTCKGLTRRNPCSHTPKYRLVYGARIGKPESDGYSIEVCTKHKNLALDKNLEVKEGSKISHKIREIVIL